mmetsp:Transcript_27642/g.57501  ORF Transcript_27642/g.57501 Transcript_27642/m.57501 type:complete len:440 (+) Transcript_27642:383-1702(+)
MPPLPSLDETDHTLPSISQMSIAEIKHELLSLNNPSFVFNQRDDLESALRAARIKTRRTDDVGLAVGVGSGGGLSSGSGSGSGNSTSAALHAAKSNTPSSNNSNGDKPNSESNGNNSVGSNNLNVNLNLNAIDNHTATTSASTAMWSDLEDLAEDKDELSRRLVEYFVMVSSVPISEVDPEIDPNSPAKNDGKSKAAQKSRRANKSRPPDPSRDKMNSRTAGRFEVRRAHLMKYSEPEQEQGGGHDSYAALGGIAESNHGGKAMTRQNSVDSTASTDEEDDGTPGRVVKFQPSVPLAFGTSKNSVNSAELEKQQSSQQQQQQQQGRGMSNEKVLELCNDGMTVVNWKHSRIPKLANALGCGKTEGCPKKYRKSDFDTVWLLTFEYSLMDGGSGALEGLEEDSERRLRQKNEKMEKTHPLFRGDWKISARVMNEGFDDEE